MPRIYFLRNQISPFRPPLCSPSHKTSHLQSGRTDGRTNKQNSPCSTELYPHRGLCPAPSHSNLHSCKAGHWVLLTTYCPWATFFSLLLPIPTQLGYPYTQPCLMNYIYASNSQFLNHYLINATSYLASISEYHQPILKTSFLFSRGHATLHLAVSVSRSVGR